MIIREVAVGGVEQALAAEKQGAERIELCDNLIEGGTTPSYGVILECKKSLRIPIVVMIRPRGGDFVYSDLEKRAMLEDVKLCSSLGVDGIAIGMLTKDNNVDYDFLKEVISIKGDLKVTFHKAIDQVLDYKNSVYNLKKIGIQRVLSSGQEDSAIRGIKKLKEIDLIEGLELVVAGKVTKENLESLKSELKTDSFHGKNIL